MKQRIALLGSTGSIGIQTLDIVRENPGLFEITTLTAHRNWERLARQAVEFDADSVVIADERRYDALRQALDGTSIKVYAGEEALRQVVQSGQVDVVVNAWWATPADADDSGGRSRQKRWRWPTKKRWWRAAVT